MAYRAPHKCPICGEPLTITRLTCNQCGTSIDGSFTGCRFCSLSPTETQFLLLFLKHRGSLKDVGQELNISYPTVRNTLDQLLASLGLDDDSSTTESSDPSPEADQSASKDPDESARIIASAKKKEILRKLARHQISADEAADLLRKL